MRRRLTAKETAESRTEYIYDAADQLLEIRRQRSDAGETDAPEIIRFSYDRLGRMLTEETAQGVLTHQYDELSNRTATTFPDGRTQRHLYYGSGHLQQINLTGRLSVSSRVTPCTVRCSEVRGG